MQHGAEGETGISKRPYRYPLSIQIHLMKTILGRLGLTSKLPVRRYKHWQTMHIIKVECVPVKRLFPCASCLSDLEKVSCGQAQEQAEGIFKSSLRSRGIQEGCGCATWMRNRKVSECLVASSHWLKAEKIQWWHDHILLLLFVHFYSLIC